MKLSFNFLGLEIANIVWEFPESHPDIPVAPVVAKGVKWMSAQWIKGMMK